MTITHALSFIERGLVDSDLRMRLNAVKSPQELENVLSEENLMFVIDDFDEAFHHRLTQCQDMEAADQLKEFKMWWALLSQTFETGQCASHCSGCCQ